VLGEQPAHQPEVGADPTVSDYTGEVSRDEANRSRPGTAGGGTH
jgi:hypothetical protein